MKNKTALQRFEEKFIPEQNSGCWIWISADTEGYGDFYFHPTFERAHRASWMLYRGEIPAGIFVLHKCDNPSCVNPNHLFLGTNDDNMKDMVRKGRQKSIRGSQHKNAKVTEDNVIEMRKLSASGMSQYKIAEMFGIGKSMANYICNRTSWKHVP